MWKIKDERDLKELEKFGFTTAHYEEYYRYCREDDYVWVDKFTRKIDYRYFDLGLFRKSVEPQTTRAKVITTKLIQAGYVEKVEE